MLAYAGFLIPYIFYYKGKLKFNIFIISLFAFCLALAIGGLWEILEYTIDVLFHTHMQRDGINDTMQDLISDATGALVLSIIGYFTIKNDWHNPFRSLLGYFIERNKHLGEK